VNGVKASPANHKSSKTTKQDEVKEGTQQIKNDKQTEVAKGVATEPDLWAISAVNPQDLMHNFQSLETGADGAISDISLWRSITENDTPESSKDGSSEPNSDISEGLDLSINLNWELPPFGPPDAEGLIDLSKLGVNPDEDMSGMFGDENNQYVVFEDWLDTDKSFMGDTTGFFMNAEIE
jgi:hypothetical protein